MYTTKPIKYSHYVRGEMMLLITKQDLGVLEFKKNNYTSNSFSYFIEQ